LKETTPLQSTNTYYDVIQTIYTKQNGLCQQHCKVTLTFALFHALVRPFCQQRNINP